MCVCLFVCSVCLFVCLLICGEGSVEGGASGEQKYPNEGNVGILNENLRYSFRIVPYCN